MNKELVAVKGDTTQATGAPSASGPRRSQKRVKITLFENWCKGCGLCTAFCPTQALEADGENKPTIQHPERCINCQWCVLHCPDLAINVSLLEEPAR